MRNNMIDQKVRKLPIDDKFQKFNNSMPNSNYINHNFNNNGNNSNIINNKIQIKKINYQNPNYMNSNLYNNKNNNNQYLNNIGNMQSPAEKMKNSVINPKYMAITGSQIQPSIVNPLSKSGGIRYVNNGNNGANYSYGNNQYGMPTNNNMYGYPNGQNYQF